MSARRGGSERFSALRWWHRKQEPAQAPAVPAAPPAVPAAAPSSGDMPTAPGPAQLPPVESLTFESDFTAFLRPDVDDTVKRAALKQLFRDPRFNVMDGLDTYIDDYTKADPIAPDVVADLLRRGFGRTLEAGPGSAAGVTAPGGGAAASETNERPMPASAHLATSAETSPALTSGNEGERAQRTAEAAERAREGGPTDVKPADERR